MAPHTPPTWISFARQKRIAYGSPREVATLVKEFSDAHPNVPLLIFDAISGQVAELDLRGSVASVLRRVPHQVGSGSPEVSGPEVNPPRGPGRPRLGVIAREVTLLPRHWDWLASQPGGASVALRKLVERAQRYSKESDRVREATEAAYRFMHSMAGDEPGFEEASRALFANDLPTLRDHLAKWPKDVRAHVLTLAERATPEQQVAAVESAL
jgi:hypothetical protein